MGQAPSTNDAIPEDYPRVLYVHYEEGESEHHCTLKLTLPKKWAPANMDQLKDFFIEHYNGKKKMNELDSSNHCLEHSSGKALRGDERIMDVLHNRDDIYLKPGKTTYKFRSSDTTESNEPKTESKTITCRNYGCSSKFDPLENHEMACRYHKEPPVFHDTKKGWKCCQSKMVYDWEDFEKIKPCMVGYHSADPPSTTKISVPSENDKNTKQENEVAYPNPPSNCNTSKEVSTPNTSVPVPMSIDDYNKNNPNAVSAVKSAKKSIQQRKIPPKREDGKSKCINFGCQREYFLDINNDKSCCHHKSPPVFHDSGKYWSCCPSIVKYDFDEFLKIPGCVVSKHRDCAVDA